MRTGIVLPDGDVLVCVFEDRTAIVVCIQVIRGRKNRDHGRELLRRRFPVHGVTRILCFVPPEHAKQVVPVQESTDRLVSKGGKRSALVTRGEMEKKATYV